MITGIAEVVLQSIALGRSLEYPEMIQVPESFEGYYREAHRPQFHFSSYKYWASDPNGMVYYQGTYHLFFQTTPGIDTRYWGHAVSADLLHWQQKPFVFPRSSSGNAVVDWNNTSGFGAGEMPPIVAFRGSTTNGQAGIHISYSNDGGWWPAKIGHIVSFLV